MTGILVTGANGFVGRRLVRDLKAAGNEVCGVVRRDCDLGRGIATRVVGDLGEDCAGPGFFSGVDAIVHLMARVHRAEDAGTDALDSYLRDNTETTRLLAAAAAAAGVKRLVFLSTAKVNGEGGETAYTEDQPPAPEDSYAISKFRAEQALDEIAGDSGLETVILRPPLVYGPGVGANFRALLAIADTPVPLPFGGLRGNARSLIYLGNLVSAIRCALDHPAAAGGIFLVRDGEDVSTAELVRRVRKALGRAPRLVAVPAGVLRGAARLIGRSAAMRRLTESLSVDDGRIRQALDWRPPYTMDQGLAATCAWYRVDKATRSA